MKKGTAKLLSDLLNGKGVTTSKTDGGDYEPAKWIAGSIEIPKDNKK